MPFLPPNQQRQSTEGTDTHRHTHTHTRSTALCPGLPEGKTNMDFTEARDSEWQWHQLGCMKVCTLLQTDDQASTPPLSFLQAGCPSCRPTNSVKQQRQSTESTDIAKNQNAN